MEPQQKIIDAEVVSTTPTPEAKVYSKNQITICTFLFGPLAGGYMLSKNFEAFGEEKLAQKTLKIFVIVLAILGLYSAQPLQFPEYLMKALPILYTIIIYQYTVKLQGDDLVEHVKKGGKLYSSWKALGVSILSLIVTVIFFLIVIFLLSPLFYS